MLSYEVCRCCLDEFCCSVAVDVIVAVIIMFAIFSRDAVYFYLKKKMKESVATKKYSMEKKTIK